MLEVGTEQSCGAAGDRDPRHGDANALVELAGLLGWGSSPVVGTMPPSGQDLAGLCCRGGILRVQGDEVVVALESRFESEDR